VAFHAIIALISSLPPNTDTHNGTGCFFVRRWVAR